MDCGCHASFNCGCDKTPACSGLANSPYLDYDWKHALTIGGALALVGLAIGWLASLEPLGLDPGWDIRVKR